MKNKTAKEILDEMIYCHLLSQQSRPINISDPLIGNQLFEIQSSTFYIASLEACEEIMRMGRGIMQPKKEKKDITILYKETREIKIGDMISRNGVNFELTMDTVKNNPTMFEIILKEKEDEYKDERKI